MTTGNAPDIAESRSQALSTETTCKRTNDQRRPLHKWVVKKELLQGIAAGCWHVLQPLVGVHVYRFHFGRDLQRAATLKRSHNARKQHAALTHAQHARYTTRKQAHR